MKNQSIAQKVKNAITGIAFTYKTESNFRLHCFSALIVIILLTVFQPPWIWWALIIICIALVIAAELINTALENLIDHLHPEIHPQIGKVKDILAGMVLVLSFTAIIIALLAVLDTLGV